MKLTKETKERFTKQRIKGETEDDTLNRLLELAEDWKETE